MANEGQVKNALDDVSQLKILKGLVIALTGGVAVLCLLLAFGIGVDKAMLTAFIGWIVPTAVNAVKEYMAGQSSDGV